MPRIRSVHPGLFSDEAFVSLSMTARICLIGVWVDADDHGVFEWKPVSIKMRVFPADNLDVPALLEELRASGHVEKMEYEGRTYGICRNFCKWQRPKEPSYRHPFPQEWHAYVGLKEKSAETIEVDLPTPTPALPQPYPSPTEKCLQREEGVGVVEGKKKEAGPNKVRTDYGEQFDNRFWGPYPRTPVMSKKEAYAAWLKLSPEDREDACLAVPRYVAWLRTKPDHPAVHACRFLSQRRFDGFKPQGSTGVTQVQIDWEHEVMRFQGGARWPFRTLGPEPGDGGCKVPRDVLEKFNITPA